MTYPVSVKNHLLEDIGESWHTAQTHDLDVYTADDSIDRGRRD